MLKKIVIAGLAVAVGVAVLAWISPPLFDWVVHQFNAGKEAAENSIPLEQRIDMLRDKVKDLDKNKQKLVDAYGKKASDVDDLQAKVNKMSDDLAQAWKRIDKFKEDLETQKASYSYQGKNYSRDEVKAQLEDEFRQVKTAEAALDAKKELLAARKQATAAAWDEVVSFNKQRDELAARLDLMEAQLQKVRAREVAASEKASDNDMANLASQIDDLNKKVNEKDKAADAATALNSGKINPLPDANADNKDDILKQIDAFKAAKNGTPQQTKVADDK